MSSTAFEFINPRYLLGISDEPKQLLQPISGYTREPLLSLEEACEPLITIVHNLPAHIWVAKENSKNPEDNLTQDESAAIRLYTMEWDAGDDEPFSSLYALLNRTLKQVDRTSLRPWFRYLKLFLTALAKLPCAPRQLVWRGVRKDHSTDYPPGTEATWWAFSSCTTSLAVLESDLYLGNTGTRTLFSIETFNARTIRAHSHFKVEDEILLLPGTCFEVKSRLNPAPDLYIIHLSQKRPPFDLLEPPFEGAELVPSDIPRRDTRTSLVIDDSGDEILPNVHRPWYKKNKIRCGLAVLVAVIVLAVVLGAVLGTQATRNSSTGGATIAMTSTTTISSSLNGSIPDPVSVADAFYAFDNNTLDLYSRRNGEVIGGTVAYVQGYVAYGQAIVLDQSVATQIQIRSGFNLNTSTSFTIEGFFMLQKTQLNAILIQLTPTIAMNLANGVLSMSLGSSNTTINTSVISTNQWHHLGVVYDATQQVVTLYIEGSAAATRNSVKLDLAAVNNNSSVIIGAGFQGYIDQFSILLKAKIPAVVLWDATVAAYYPLDEVWTLDQGPNGMNATASNIASIFGWHWSALNFNISGATFVANGFTALATPMRAFTVALWVRTETQPGVFLTIADPDSCFLVLGLQTSTNNLVAYLPNATASGQNVNIIGPEMPSNAWVHVAFTWSLQNRARLYTSGFLQKTGTSADTLNNDQSGNSFYPMTVTLGQYNGGANCQGIDGVNTSKQFMGSLDELYIFARELQSNEINDILRPKSS